MTTAEQAERQHKTHRASGLAARMSAAFLRLAHGNDVADRQTANALRAWEQAGRQGQAPPAVASPLERVFVSFHEIFPELRLVYGETTKGLLCHRAGIAAAYPPAALSDGEKQVLCLLVEIAALGERGALVVVDEPELNLHTSLAIRLWDVLEAALPDSQFMYATHNVAFAMRANVETVVVLSAKKSPLFVAHAHDVPAEDLREFLGAAPVILASDRLLAVEGEADSFDLPFYKWLLDEPGLAVVALGDCNAVRATAKGAGVWAGAAQAGVHTLGVVDRDFRSDPAVRDLESEGLVVLPFHEAESFLCEPTLFAALGTALGLVQPPPTEEEVLDRIVQHAKKNALGIALRRVALRAHVTFALSMGRSEMSSVGSIEDAAAWLAQRVNASFAEVSWKEASNIQPLIEREHAAVANAATERNVVALLRLVPGKELLSDLARMIGCSSSSLVLNGARKHVDVTAFGNLAGLRKRLRDGLAPP